jgi:hypothetical protein
MGNSASTSDIASLKSEVKALQTKTSDYADIKTKVADSSSNLAKSIDYEALAKKITDVSSYNEKVAAALASNPGKLGEGLAAKIGQDASVINRIWTGLQDNTTFAKTVSDKLTDDASAYRSRLQGDRGPAGEIAGSKDVAKLALYDKKYTLWCADGDVCQVPVGNKGIQAPTVEVSRIKIGNWYIEPHGGPDGNLHFHKGDVNDWFLSVENGKSISIRTEKVNGKNVRQLADDFYWTLENNMVRRDRHYAINGNKGFLQAADGCHNHDGCKGNGIALFGGGKGAWEKFNFDQY